MINNLLIGESGGSKTDWVLLMDNVLIKFSTESMHPKSWKSFKWEELRDLLEEKGIQIIDVTLLFFGAGCNSKLKAQELKSHFEAFNFKSISVQGDLKAAGLATLGSKKGHVAILGSGSVLIDFQNSEVQQFYGGLGRELGDEGGGYYFGKTVLHDFQNRNLSKLQMSSVQSVLNLLELESVENEKVSDNLVLRMAHLLFDKMDVFEDYHKRNMQLFFDKYVCGNMRQGVELQFVGSYAFYHKSLLKTVCEKNNYTCGTIIARPIDKLIDYYKKTFDENEI